MPSTKETISTRVLVTPEWDRKSLNKMERDFGKVQKRMASMKMDWGQVNKGSVNAVKEIKRISDAAVAMSGSLSAATRRTVKELSELGKQLKDAKKKAEDLKRKAASASSPEEGQQASAGAAEAEKQMADLSRQIKEHKRANKQQLRELNETVKARKRERESLRKAASYTGKDFRKDFMSSIGRARSGGVRGAASGIAGAVQAGGRYSAGVSARSSLSGGMGIGAGLSKLVPLLAGAAGGVAAFIGFIAKASKAITGMNKSLLEGAGYANDFTSKAGAYTEAVDDMRKATKDASLSLIVMGGNAEDAAKIVNSYMREASGSIIKTRDAMLSLGSGDTARGVELLAKNAIMYGKALGMEVTDVASMVGTMENEIGLGARQTQSLMADIVKAAATSSMPVHKFMDIFRQTTPELELYTNRMEELAGVIKMLSKNMSPGDVKKFMDAFSRGFKGQSFEERIKHTLVAGVGTTNKILKDGFLKKADVLGSSLNELGGGLGDQFVEAFKRGDKSSMQDILVQAKSKGASAATIGESQKLMGVEADRRGGGALGTASALKGASMRDMSKMMEAEVGRLIKQQPGARISELKELVAERMGYSQDQIDALNQFNDSMNLYQKSLQEYGTTVSRSMDAALKKIVAKRMGKGEDQVTPEDMAKASRDEIEMAAELSNKDAKVQQTAMDLARENTDATVSVGEKLENVVSYILEQIYEKADGMLKVLNRILNSVLDWLSGDGAKTKAKAQVDKYNISGYGKAEQGQFDAYKSKLKGGIESGKTGMGLAGSAGEYYKAQHDKMKAEGNDAGAQAMKDAMKATIEKMMSGKGMHKAQKENLMRGVGEALDSGKFGKALEAVVAYSGKGDADSLLEFGQTVLPKAIAEADRKAAEGGPMRRDGTSATQVNKFQKDKEVADEISDTVSDLKRISQGGTSSTEKMAAAADAMKKAAAPAAQDGSPRPAGGPAGGPDPLVKTIQQGRKDELVQQQEAAEAAAKASENVYDGIHDVASILKKGIRFEPSFLNGPFSKALRDSSLDAFRDALIEFAVIQAKAELNPGFQRFLSDYSHEFTGMGSGAAMGLLTGDVGKGHSDPNAVLKQFQDQQDKLEGSKQMGGPIPETGNYRLHRGEYVVPAVQSDRKGQSGSTVNNVTINGSNLSQKQLEGAVFTALDKISRRP